MNRQSSLSALEFARTTYREISLYSPDRSPSPVDLSDNTNVFGVPPAALAVLRGAAESTVTRYPALYADELKTALARYVGVDPTEIVTGCGSDDVLDSAIRAFAEPGHIVATPDPSFVMIPILARMNGLRSVEVPLRPDHDIDVDGLLAPRARITYVCSPNNPTGTLARPESVQRVLDEAPGIVILDQAYAEYGGLDYARVATRSGNAIAVRTLSKAFGLAGLRVGYGVGPASLIAEVEKARGPYKVNALAERAAVAALTNDLNWVQARIDDVRENRERFVTDLRSAGFAPLPSHANFVLVPVPNAANASAQLRRAGIAVRPMPGLAVVGDALRISIGTWPMMESVLAALRKTA